MHFLFETLLFAAKKHAEADSAPAGKSDSLSWFIVIFFVVLGLAVTLTPPRRTFEVKRPKDE